MTQAQLQTSVTMQGETAPLWYFVALARYAELGASAPSSAGRTSPREPSSSAAGADAN
jgi:hypothetical protein